MSFEEQSSGFTVMECGGKQSFFFLPLNALEAKLSISPQGLLISANTHSRYELVFFHLVH